MEITFVNEYRKQFIEILPCITLGWRLGTKKLCVGWLYWYMFLEWN